MEFISRSKTHKFVFENDIKPQFPNVEKLLEKAEKCTNSCVHVDQVIVSRNFFKTVAMRGVYSRKYSLEEVRRASILIDYMAENRARQLGRFELSMGAG